MTNMIPPTEDVCASCNGKGYNEKSGAWGAESYMTIVCQWCMGSGKTPHIDAAQFAADILLGELLGGAKVYSMKKQLILYCPECKKQHLDKGEWFTKEHKTHLCEYCGVTWRPYDYPTVGVGNTCDGCGGMKEVWHDEYCPNTGRKISEQLELCAKCAGTGIAPERNV